MTDISKCTGENGKFSCPKKGVCFRYLAPDSPNGQQSYMVCPLESEEDTCPFYWPAYVKNLLTG